MNLPASLRADPRPRGECLIDRYAALAAEQHAVDLTSATDEGAPPPALLAALARALAAHTPRYPDFAGEPALRACVAAQRARRDRVATEAHDVVITAGATGGLAAAFSILLAPDDELITFAPGYALPLAGAYARGARVRAARLRPAPTPASASPDAAPTWSFDPAELAALFGPRTRAVLLTSPHSPTGKVFSAREIELLVELCRSRGAFLIHDAVYEDFELGRSVLSPRALYPEGTLVIGSASKGFRAPGLRVGWVTARRDVCERMARLQEETTSGASKPAQVALAEVLAADTSALARPAPSCELHARHERVRRALARGGLECLPAEGGLCFVARRARAGPEGDRSEGDGSEGDVALVHELLARGIACVPLSEFGQESCDVGAAVRVGFGRADETLARLEACLDGAGEQG